MNDPTLDNSNYNTMFYKYGPNQPDNVVVKIEDDLCCAKCVENLDTNTKKYFIRTSGRGIFNPSDIDARDHSLNLRKGLYKWSKVSEECFTLYANFLRSSNKYYLHLAERKI